MISSKTKDKILGYLKRGYPESTAVSLSRAHLDDYREELLTDKDFHIDVEESKASGMEPILRTLIEAARVEYKPAIEYLQRRAKEDWSVQEKITLHVERAKEDILMEIKSKLPQPLFEQFLTYWAEE